jgi:hypothetical protein
MPQLIDTAPKDETWVILLGQQNGEPHGCVAFWSPDGGWYDSEAASNPVTAFGWQPTHWMPLPKLES